MCACILVSQTDVDATLAGPQSYRMIAESEGGKQIARITQLSQPTSFYAAPLIVCSVSRHVSVSARNYIERLPTKSRQVKGCK